MPFRLARPCGHTGCPALVEGGGYCEKHKRERKLTAAPRPPRPSRHERGYGNDWDKLRREYLAKHEWCEPCARAGRSTPATRVHHKQSVEEYPHLRLEWYNLEACCKSCHERQHERGIRAKK